MGLAKTIQRNMRREVGSDVADRKGLICPNCKNRAIKRKNPMSREVTCFICGWKGIIK